MRLEINRSLVFENPSTGERFVIPPTRPETIKQGERVGFRTVDVNAPDWVRRTREFQLAESEGSVKEVKGAKGKKIVIAKPEASQTRIVDHASGAKIVTKRGAKNARHRQTRAALPSSQRREKEQPGSQAAR